MLVKASEAKKLFCPFCFAGPETESLKCAASNCMAWNVVGNHQLDADGDLGYCGAFGKPAELGKG